MENELTPRNKWGFAVNCAPRDLTFILVSLFFMTFVQFTAGLTPAQFSVLTVIIVACRVWDAVNDPMMSAIITNTKSRFGKYRPWILAGAIVNSIFLVLLFLSPGLSGWGYVAYLGVIYLLYGMTFTMNDVSYWSLLPSLARSKDNRDKLTGMVAIFASVGSFVGGALIPIITTGNMVEAYRYIAIFAACLFVVSQVLVFFLVKDKSAEEGSEKSIGLKEMFRIIFKNKQLLVMAGVTLLYSLSSSLLTAFGTNFFYFKFGYNGDYVTIFTVVYAVGTLVAQFLFTTVAAKFKRKDIVKVTSIIVIVGYLVFFGLTNMPKEWFGHDLVYLALLCLGGLVIFAAEGIFYLTMLVMLTNTIEYDEWKTGNRNEAIIFSVRPFMVKLSAALQQGVLSVVLLASGLYTISNQIATLEGTPGLELEDKIAQANGYIFDSVNGVTPLKMFVLTIGMCLIPVLLFVGIYLLCRKKYFIDEPMYEQLVTEINARKEALENGQEIVLPETDRPEVSQEIIDKVEQIRLEHLKPKKKKHHHSHHCSCCGHDDDDDIKDEEK